MARNRMRAAGGDDDVVVRGHRGWGRERDGKRGEGNAGRLLPMRFHEFLPEPRFVCLGFEAGALAWTMIH